MKSLKWCYGWLLVLGYGLLLVFAIAPHIFATLAYSRLRGDSDSQRRARLGRLHYFWGVVTWYYVHFLMHIKVEVSIDPAVVQGGPYITIANHRSALDHVMIYVAARAAGIKDLRWVLKKSMRKAPVIGWLNAMMGSAFLSRNQDPADIHRLERTAEFAQADHASVHLYPEGTRYKGVPEEGARFAHVREPRRRGYETFVRTLPTHRTLSITIDWGEIDGGVTLSQVSEFLGRRVRLNLRDLGVVSPDQAADTLNKCWVAHEFFLHDK